MRVTDLRTMIVELPLERPTRTASGGTNDRTGCGGSSTSSATRA